VAERAGRCVVAIDDCAVDREYEFDFHVAVNE
jgi:hypothetical protein